MFALVKGMVDRLMVVSHHAGHGFSGAIAFGFVAYLLDIGGFRTQALTSGGVHGHALTAMGAVVATFIALNVAMKQLMGKHGVF